MKPNTLTSWALPVLGVLTLAWSAAMSQSHGAVLSDDFEGPLTRWEVSGAGGVATRNSGDSTHKRVLVLSPNGDVHALLRGTERWRGVRLEGDVMFPTATDAYLGVIYNFRRRGERTDFGLIYLKGNESYLQANPHRDYNVSRTLYPEYRVDLTGTAATRVGVWQHFKVEVVGDTCHFYVGDMTTPQMSFALSGLSGGAVGLQPRSVGGSVWVDGIVATEIAQLSYHGTDAPDVVRGNADSARLKWELLGPFTQTEDAVARDPRSPDAHWQPFGTDARGAVVTGAVVDYHGPRTVAYFHTRVRAESARDALFHVSTVDDLALWVNGRFQWFISRGDAAWFDFSTNPRHAGTRIPVALVRGDNDFVVRVRGGRYATGGFYASVE